MIHSFYYSSCDFLLNFSGAINLLMCASESPIGEIQQYKCCVIIIIIIIIQSYSSGLKVWPVQKVYPWSDSVRNRKVVYQIF